MRERREEREWERGNGREVSWLEGKLILFVLRLILDA